MKNGKTILTRLFPRLLLIFTFFALAACSEPPVNATAKQAAQNFVTAYYTNADTPAAIKYTMGSAKEKLTRELAVIKESGVDTTKAEKPETTVEALSAARLSENEMSLSWSVTASTGNKLTATTVVQKAATDWLVSKLMESASPGN